MDINTLKFAYTGTWCRAKRTWLAKRVLAATSSLAVLCSAEMDDLESALVCDKAALNSEGNSGSAVKLCLCGFHFSVVFSNSNVFNISDCAVSGWLNIS